MFPRRKVTGPAHSPESNPVGSVRLSRFNEVERSFSGTVGASYISSSSSSSRSSSPPVTNPVRRSVRVETRRRRANTTHQHLHGRPVSSRHLRISNEQVTHSGQNLWNERPQAVSNAHIRSAFSLSSKPINRTRRRTLLRSPIVRLILSSTGSSPPRHSETLSQSGASITREPVEHRGMDRRSRTAHADATEIRTRPRTTRSGARATRTNPLSRRQPQPAPAAGTIPTQNAEQNNQLESQAVMNSDEFRAVLNASRSEGADGDDECVICLDLKANRSIVIPCMHTFCFECIYRWLCINPSCPLCKRLAHRLIHSILSDSDFTETLVSELQTQRTAIGPHRITGLSPSFDLEEDGVPTSRQQSHHHFHYHLDASPVRFLDYLGGMTHGSTTRAPFFIPPILLPSETPLSRTSSITNVLGGANSGPHRIPYRWSSGYESSAETHRSLLIDLVNNALRPRFSSLLDGLLLRQLVYVFGFDSIPVSQEPDLERNISPNFLADNEAQLHRLEAFVRRELRVLAPWLAYQSNDIPSSSVLRESSDGGELEQAIPAVTSPLICGAPGLLAETPELDSITSNVVRHFTSVPMTDETALIDLLSSIPALRPPLVPATYLSHFASEIVQFARYTGTLEQYDSAVCLYRRRLPSVTLQRPHDGNRVRRPDPRLAVYVASACWPRLRPGFSQPQGLVTHPLNTWLLQRLFVHSVTGSTHPARLSGTGETPPTLPEQIIFPSLSSSVCHSNCMRLSNISRALLGALPSLARTRSSTSIRSVDLTVHERYDNSMGQNSGGVRPMTSAELYPNRLLYQRVLSELIDQARFSEALSEYFHQYSSVREQHNNTVPVDLTQHEHQVENSAQSDMDITPGSSATLQTVITSIQPALKVHSLALRRLNGLLLLFTARIPGLTNTAATEEEDEEDWVSELLHLPLLHLTMPPPVIDLTSTGNQQQRARRRPTVPLDSVSTLPGADWTFLRQLPWDTIGSSENRLDSRNPYGNTTESGRLTSTSTSVLSTISQAISSLFFSPNRSTNSEGTNQLTTVNSSASPTRESVWRNPASSCVIISSDSSSEDESAAQHIAARCRLTTDDESGVDANEAVLRLVTSKATTGNRMPSRDNRDVETNVENAALQAIEEDAGNLSLNQEIVIATESTPVTHLEEPMEIDERAEEAGNFQVTAPSGSKRPVDGNVVSNNETNESRPSKLAKVEAYFSKLPREWQDFLIMQASANIRTGTSSRSSRFTKTRPGTRRHISRSRSPVLLDDTSDSDCEILREYIRVESDSCSSPCLSDSVSATSSSSSRSRSPGMRETKHRSHRRPCHHCRKRRAKRHYRTLHVCHCSSKHRRTRVHPTILKKKRHHHRRAHHHPPIPFTTSDYPILISDDEEEVSHAISANNLQLSPLAQKEQIPFQAQAHDSSGGDSINGSFSTEPSSSMTRPDMKFSQNTATSTCDLPPALSPSSSAIPPLPIFEPSTVDDFYQFLERFDHLSDEPNISESRSEPSQNVTGIKLDHVDNPGSIVPSSFNVFPGTPRDDPEKNNSSPTFIPLSSYDEMQETFTSPSKPS